MNWTNLDLNTIWGKILAVIGIIYIICTIVGTLMPDTNIGKIAITIGADIRALFSSNVSKLGNTTKTEEKEKDIEPDNKG